MFTACNPLLAALVVLCMTSEALAQDGRSVADADVGKAYKFNGLTKYLTAPSKFLFGDKKFLSSDIVNGYRVDLTTGDWDCLDGALEIVILTGTRGEWWSQPVYVETDTKNKDELEEVIVVLKPDSESLAVDGCLQPVPPEKFVVDERISQELRISAKPTPSEK